MWRACCALGILCTFCTGCEGSIDGRQGAREQQVAAPGAAIGGTPQAGTAGNAGNAAMTEQVRAADEAMRAENPELFDIALKYFPGEQPEHGATRLARLTRLQLDLTTQTLLPALNPDSAQSAIPRDPLQTNYEYSDNLSFNAANFTPMTDWVAALSAQVAQDPAALIDCSAQGDAPACLEAGARAFITDAFRGAVSDAQLARFSDFYLASVAQVGLPQATADLLDITLTSPSYLFRDEVQTDASARLLPAQWLQSLSYTLADGPPQMLGLPVTGPLPELASPAVLEQTLASILSNSAAREKLMRFFIAWLEVREPDEFTIAPEVFPEFTPELAQAMVEETRKFLEHQLAAVAPRLDDITQADESFVSEALAIIYGPQVFSQAAGQGGQTPVALDQSQRLGIFTLPAVIASHSGPSTTRLVKRGVFFTRKIMCLPLGAPPEDVDTTVPETAGATERQRIESVTADARCQGCHAFINPFGFMQENYDPIGRWRTTDEGQPVDPSMQVDFLDEGTLSTSSPVDALRQLTSSLRFQQCFARQLFRFYMGRDEQRGDDPVLRQMFFEFANPDSSGGSQDILGMLQTLAGSPLLSHRTDRMEAP